MERHFPVSKKLNLKDKLNNFKALLGESISSSWDRFTGFMRIVPNHRIDDESLKEYFYRGQEDAGALTSPYTISMLHFVKALCDLGASIKLMQLSIHKKLGLGAPKLTTMCLLMADRIVKDLLECSKMSL